MGRKEEETDSEEAEEEVDDEEGRRMGVRMHILSGVDVEGWEENSHILNDGRTKGQRRHLPMLW